MRPSGGTALTFGVSGKFADDNLVLYDRETGSEWKQSTGECIAGPLEGEQLRMRPSSVTTARALCEAYDEPQVLDPVGRGRYGRRAGPARRHLRPTGGVGSSLITWTVAELS